MVCAFSLFMKDFVYLYLQHGNYIPDLAKYVQSKPIYTDKIFICLKCCLLCCSCCSQFDCCCSQLQRFDLFLFLMKVTIMTILYFILFFNKYIIFINIFFEDCICLNLKNMIVIEEVICEPLFCLYIYKTTMQ